MIETNLDSIILRELEIFVNWDLSIIGRVRLVKKTRQGWWQKVGAILKVGWHYKIKLNCIVLTTVRFMQQQNGQLSSTQLQLQSRKKDSYITFVYSYNLPHCNVIWLFELRFCQHLSRRFGQCYLDGSDCPATFWR